MQYFHYLSCLQASIYKQDFEQERGDRQNAMGRFEEERGAFQADIVKLNEKMKAMHLKHDETVTKLEQLKELSVTHKEVRIKFDYLHHHLQFVL